MQMYSCIVMSSINTYGIKPLAAVGYSVALLSLLKNPTLIMLPAFAPIRLYGNVTDTSEFVFVIDTFLMNVQHQEFLVPEYLYSLPFSTR
jgi:hypothetical protein